MDCNTELDAGSALSCLVFCLQAIYWLSHQAMKQDAVRARWEGLRTPGRPLSRRVTRSSSQGQAGGQVPGSSSSGATSSQNQLAGCTAVGKQVSGGRMADDLAGQDAQLAPDQGGIRHTVQLPPQLVASICQPIGSGICGAVYKGW